MGKSSCKAQYEMLRFKPLLKKTSLKVALKFVKHSPQSGSFDALLHS